MAGSVNLEGAVTVVTGAGSGIGRATALMLAGRGARVHVVDVDGAAAQRVAEEIAARTGSAVAHTVDVADPAAVEALAAEVFSGDGRVDVLHNNAGIGHGANIEATTVQDWQRVITVNLLGVAYGVQAFVPRMLEQGRPAAVINTASVAGLLPTAKLAPYCASKYGVVGLTEALNAELSKRGIHFTAICPGVIDTAIVATGTMRGELGELQEKAVDFYARRGVSPDEVAEAVLRAIERHRLIVPVPRRQVTIPYLLHRVSPRIVQPLARNMEWMIRRG